MGLEQLGVGGVLTFDEAPGLAGMRRASAGLATLETRFNTFKGRIQGLGAELEKFNLFGIGLASAGIFGFGGLVKSAFQAKSEVEDMQIVLASTLKMTNKNIKELGDFGNQAGTAMGIAAEQMEILEANAAVAPGETKDLLNIYKQILGPMSAAGQSLDQVQKATVGAAIASQALGIDFDNMGYGLQRLISGQIRSADMLYRSLHAQNLIKESAQEWAALPVGKRLEKINALMDKYNESANLVGGTWSAMSGTVISIAKVLARGFITPLFNMVKGALEPITKNFVKDGETIRYWLEAAEEKGRALVPVFTFIVDVFKRVRDHVRLAYNWIEKVYQRIEKFDPNSGGQMRGLGVQVGALAIDFGMLVPVLSLARLALGPVVALFQVGAAGARLLISAIGSIGSIIGAVSLPAVLALGAAITLAAAAFYEFREGGESIGQTLSRLWSKVIQPFITGFRHGFMAFVPDIIRPLQEAWDDLEATIVLLFDTIGIKIGGSKSDWNDYGDTTGAALGSIAQGAAWLVNALVEGFNVVVFALLNVKYAFESVGTAIGTFFFNATVGITNLVKVMYNAVTAPLRAIVNVLADVLSKLGRTKLGRSLAGKLGFDPSEAAEDLRKLTVGNGGLASSAYIDEAKYEYGESPQDASIRLQRERDDQLARAQAQRQVVEVTINDKREMVANVNLKVDGQVLSQAQARAQLELNERAGASVTPWQRRAAVVRGKQLPSR